MSTSGLSLGSTSGSLITVTGLASGLDTSSIIAALMNVEREPVTHLSDEQSKLQAAQSELQGVQGSLQQLAALVSEFAEPSLFEDSQTVTSNEPARVSASVGAGAGAAIGGYEVEVTSLANAAQRTFAFTSPASEDAITIEGQEFKATAGESARELADTINLDSHASVYAVALEGGTIVLSSRQTGATGGEFIKVTDTGGTLKEVENTAREGQDAKFKVDGVEGSSASNTVTDAIPGVTLTLGGLTPQGPVTIDVQPPGANTGALEAKVQAFVKLYNSTVEALQRQLNTKPPAKPDSSGEFGVGTLFADVELTSLLDGMRQSMYEPIAGLESATSSPVAIGLSTGAPTAGTTSQSSLEGLLTLEPGKLGEAVKADPTGVQQMLQGWSSKLQGLMEAASGPGGSLEARINGDSAQITQLKGQISNMDELLAAREKALQATYAQLERVIAQNTAQGDYLTKQLESSTSSSSSG